ncbi:RING-H2 finger protein [Musa troglodytarum]|uniref:RING-H2 finger protein n=1 Tax=Musa troglodytarum TaxID=320322 RepID=A0A9E7KRY9_9LILI|nr:RING-H2 finger protein [Musa troglodytarum]
MYLRAKHCWGAIPVSRGAPASLAPAPRLGGLEASAVAALPSVLIRFGGLKDGAECAVCLCELSEGDAARLLPKCGHGFHLECIDMWFRSHSTCPLCRSSVDPQVADRGAELVPGDARSLESSPDSAANVLLCASDDQSSSTLSSSSEEALVIEIPRRAVAGFQTPNSPLPETRSPTAPTSRSLRRFLVRESRIAGASCSPRARDMDQGCSTGTSS